MLKRFFKLAIRNLFKQKQITIVCILGLIIAFSVVLQIANGCAFELSFDKYQSKADRIYRFTVEENRPEENFYWHFARCWQTWRQKLPEFYPEIESLIEIRPMWNSVVKSENTHFYTNNAFAVDSSVFKVFNFDFITGDPKTAINSENTLVLSESMAHKLFPGKNAVNQVIELYGRGTDNFEKFAITGVYKDMPQNSHFHADFLVHYSKQKDKGTDFAYTYILLKKGTDISQIVKLNEQFIKTHAPEEEQKGSFIHYTPLKDIHLKSHIEREVEPNGDIKQVKLFLIIGLGVLLIALVNYFNLFLVAYNRRNKYFSINEIIGGRPRHNIFLAFLESLCIAIFVISISLIVYKPLSSFLSASILQKTIPASFNSTQILVIVALFVLVIVFGILPLLLVRIKAVGFLNNDPGSRLRNNKSWLINNPMLVFQFAISIIVIISSLVLNKQNSFLMSKNLGHTDRNIIMVSRNFWQEEPEVMLFKDKLLKIPVVEDVSMCMDPPGYLVKDARPVQYADIPQENKNQILTILPVDGNFFSFFKLPMVAGETRDYATGQQYENYVLNEAAIKKLGFKSAKDAIGTKFKLQDFNQGIIQGGTIIGVVRDFNFSSLYTPVEPTVFFSKPIWQWRYLVKLSPGNASQGLTRVKQVWDEVFPEYPFDYQFLDDLYKEYYNRDLITGKLVAWFSIICIIISCIGLWGISSILMNKRTKEIGIRKVNGARVTEIVTLLNSSFLRWIIIAYIIAVPLSWYVMQKWLENFAYKTELSWWIFIVSGVFAIAVAILTVSWQCWRTASRNPIEALRYE